MTAESSTRCSRAANVPPSLQPHGSVQRMRSGNGTHINCKHADVHRNRPALAMKDAL